jgi:transcriptional regulator GlxA family with amidase domain
MDQKKYKIAFYLQNGVEVLDFAGPMEVFSYAQFEVFTVSKTKDPITSQGILKIIPDYSIEDAPKADIIAFFGGNAGAASGDPKVIEWLLQQQTPDYYFSVCTGAFILGKAGLLNNLTVTTFHESIENLKKAVPSANVLSNVRFVDNGKVITTAGISAGIDGALHLVSKIRGEAAAKEVARYMEYDKWVPQQGLIINKSK